VRRAFVLSHLAGLSFGRSKKEILRSLKELDLWDEVTPNEEKMLTRRRIKKAEKLQTSWLPEAIQVFAWGLSRRRLAHFEFCDEDLVDVFPPNQDPKPVVDSARRREFSEIFSECDLLYRLHWAVRDSCLKGVDAPISEDLASERDRAIRWLAGVEPDWDEVTTDT
jgi:hypothetical protein